MEKLTNIIEAILFASGKAVACSDICDKLSITNRELHKAFKELKEKYGEDGGLQLLEFNNKAQIGSNPAYKAEVESVLNPIREKELTRTILETVAIIAYKQPITRTEIEIIRGLNSDYAVNALLELKLIEPCGRKDAVGHPVLFATTDEFLKRFRLQSLADLPDYEELMKAIKKEEDRDNYLYARQDENKEGDAENPEQDAKPEEKPTDGEDSDGSYEIPDFLRGLDNTDIVKIC